MLKNNRSETIAPIAGSDSVRETKEELARLGEIKESLITDIAMKEKLASDYNGIDKKVEEAEIELERLEKEIAKANHLKSDLEIVESKLNETKEFNATISFQTKELLAKHDKLSADIKILEDNYAQKKVELNSAILSYKDEIAKYENDLANISEKVKKVMEEHGVVVAKNKDEQDKLINEISESKSFLSEVNSHIQRSADRLAESENKIEQADKKAKELITNAELYCERIKKEADELVAKKEQELIDREGVLSERESWLVDKEQTLKDTKLELEKFYGRKINNVNI